MSTACKKPFLNSSYFSQTFDIPAHPRVHIRSRLKQKCHQTSLCAILRFQRISIILFERSSWDSAVYLEKFRMLGLALSLWLVNLSVSIRAQYSDRWSLGTFQDFLLKLGMKPRMGQVIISIFSLNNVTVRLNKIMDNLLKHLKILIFKVVFQCWKLI